MNIPLTDIEILELLLADCELVVAYLSDEEGEEALKFINNMKTNHRIQMIIMHLNFQML